MLLLLLRSKRREKRYDYTLSTEILRLAASGSLRRGRLLAAEIDADINAKLNAIAPSHRGRRKFNCSIAASLKTRKATAFACRFYYGQLRYQKFSGKINSAYIIVVLGHRLRRTSAKLNLVRAVTASVLICLRFSYTQIILC